MNNDNNDCPFVSIDLVGYIKERTTDPMECDHTDIMLRMEVSHDHNGHTEYGEFCGNCNARLDGVHGIIHYNKQFKYQDRKKNNEFK